ncbi:hypothetical protein SARC_09140, partial [Sphaeroforma arctica JP610]
MADKKEDSLLNFGDFAASTTNTPASGQQNATDDIFGALISDSGASSGVQNTPLVQSEDFSPISGGGVGVTSTGQDEDLFADFEDFSTDPNPTESGNGGTDFCDFGDLGDFGTESGATQEADAYDFGSDAFGGTDTAIDDVAAEPALRTTSDTDAYGQFGTSDSLGADPMVKVTDSDTSQSKAGGGSLGMSDLLGLNFSSPVTSPFDRSPNTTPQPTPLPTPLEAAVPASASGSTANADDTQTTAGLDSHHTHDASDTRPDNWPMSAWPDPSASSNPTASAQTDCFGDYDGFGESAAKRSEDVTAPAESKVQPDDLDDFGGFGGYEVKLSDDASEKTPQATHADGFGDFGGFDETVVHTAKDFPAPATEAMAEADGVDGFGEFNETSLQTTMDTPERAVQEVHDDGFGDYGGFGGTGEMPSEVAPSEPTQQQPDDGTDGLGHSDLQAPENRPNESEQAEQADGFGDFGGVDETLTKTSEGVSKGLTNNEQDNELGTFGAPGESNVMRSEGGADTAMESARDECFGDFDALNNTAEKSLEPAAAHAAQDNEVSHSEVDSPITAQQVQDDGFAYFGVVEGHEATPSEDASDGATPEMQNTQFGTCGGVGTSEVRSSEDTTVKGPPGEPDGEFGSLGGFGEAYLKPAEKAPVQTTPQMQDDRFGDFGAFGGTDRPSDDALHNITRDEQSDGFGDFGGVGDVSARPGETSLGDTRQGTPEVSSEKAQHAKGGFGGFDRLDKTEPAVSAEDSHGGVGVSEGVRESFGGGNESSDAVGLKRSTEDGEQQINLPEQHTPGENFGDFAELGDSGHMDTKDDFGDFADEPT